MKLVKGENQLKKKENEINIRGDFEIINAKRIRLVRFRQIKTH